MRWNKLCSDGVVVLRVRRGYVKSVEKVVVIFVGGIFDGFGFLGFKRVIFEGFVVRGKY